MSSKTPEGAVKDLIVKCLEARGIFPAKKAGAFPGEAQGWYFMPVQSMGVKGIPDFVGCVNAHFWGEGHLGLFFAIEAKAPNKKPTGFQALQIAAIRQGGGRVFVIDGPDSLKEFEAWVDC